MLSRKLNVTLLSTLMKKHGISDVVVCPGSRHITFVNNMASDPFFKLYSVIDERAAAFFAIGLSLQSGRPAAVTCTQGSAILVMHTAVSEAHYQKVPLLLISTDMHKGYIEQMDGLTTDQHNLFKKLAKMEVELPLVDDNRDPDLTWQCSNMINQALAMVKSRPWGPVHINIPISEGIDDFRAPEPQVIPYERGCFKRALEIINHRKKRVLYIGQRTTKLNLDPELVKKLEERYIIYNEHLSNINGFTLGASLDLMLLNPDNYKMAFPDVVVSFGQHMVNPKVKDMLRKSDCVHIQINDRDEFNDTFKHLKLLVFSEEPGLEVLKKLAEAEPMDQDYKKAIFEKCQGIRDHDFPYCEMAVIKKVLHSVRDDEYVHVSNSSPAKYAEYFTMPSTATYLCNRGINGIDGSMSTFMGYAQHAKTNNYMITGDLSFFYDVNGFWHNYIPDNAKIILINNHGGEIFRPFPNFDKLDEQTKYLILSKHKANAKHVCETYGMEHYEAHDQQSFDSAWQAFKDSKKAAVLECFTEIDRDIEELNKYFAEIRSR